MNPTDQRLNILAGIEVALVEPENREVTLRALHDRLVELDRRDIEADDVIYIRHGASPHLAWVCEVGTGPDEGYLLVRVWLEGAERFQRMKRVVLEDERGWPSLRDPRVRRVQHEIAKFRSVQQGQAALAARSRS